VEDTITEAFGPSMPTACTIIACNYLPFATVLAESFFAHHPSGSFTVLLIDDEARQLRPGDSRIDWRRLSDLGIDQSEVHRLAGIYDVTELATAVKPLLLQALIEERRAPVLYLDPDIRIYAPLDHAVRLAGEHGIVLTPHSMQPYPRDDRQVDAAQILASGVYNLGFIAVGPEARPFLDWWWQATRREALSDLTRMMFTDQRWVDFAPCFFDHHILKDPAYNVAYWNLHGRRLSSHDGEYLVDGAPLRFFHFSGFSPRMPHLLSKHQGRRPRILLSENVALQQLCDEYLASVERAGLAEYADIPYGWSMMTAGLPLATRMRRLYRDGVIASDDGQASGPPDPFDTANPGAFVEWLNAPAEGGPRRVSRYLHSIYKDRIDLQIRFPDVGGADAEAFADWVWKYGVVDEVIPLELRPPVGSALPRTEYDSCLATGERLLVTGYFRAELGIGEAARLLTTALGHAGIDYSTSTNAATLSRQAHPFEDRPPTMRDWDINVLCVNADTIPQLARDTGPAFFAGRHTAGYWFWEIEQFPPSMYSAFEHVDEVWTATDFVAEAVRAAGRRPVFTIPLPVPSPQYSPSITRARLGLRDRFTFLLLFDLLSVMERKNPLGVIDAFSQAFTPDEGPMLVLKTINGERCLPDLERLRAAARHRPDIVVIDAYYTAEEKNALIGLSDCYVSLHRSEGLGLTMAEAMAAGKPVIATGYSGNLHFMTPETSYLVDYTLTTVPAGCDPYPVGAVWAQPNVGQAAGFMREVYDRPEAAALRGRRGQADILQHHNVSTSAAAVAARVQQIRRDRKSYVIMPGITTPVDTRIPTRPTPESAGTEPLEQLFPHLDRLANLTVGGGGQSLSGLRQAAQRLLFRLLRPYAFQQRQLQEQLITALRHAAAAIREEQHTRERLDARVRELTRELLIAKRELRRLQGEAARVTEHVVDEKTDARTSSGV
jgi:glycosyltransferase involved in cell wall biosynthesis